MNKIPPGKEGVTTELLNYTQIGLKTKNVYETHTCLVT
jgi:hypothetical protein